MFLKIEAVKKQSLMENYHVWARGYELQLGIVSTSRKCLDKEMIAPDDKVANFPWEIKQTSWLAETAMFVAWFSPIFLHRPRKKYGKLRQEHLKL